LEIRTEVRAEIQQVGGCCRFFSLQWLVVLLVDAGSRGESFVVVDNLGSHDEVESLPGDEAPLDIEVYSSICHASLDVKEIATHFNAILREHSALKVGGLGCYSERFSRLKQSVHAHPCLSESHDAPDTATAGVRPRRQLRARR